MMGKKKTAKMMGGGTVKKTARMKGGGPVKKMAKGGSAINQHKAMAMGMMGGGTVKKTAKMKGGGKVARMNMGGRTGDMMYSRGYGVDERGKRMPTELMTAPGMKKGGKVKKSAKKKQGYKARKDESIAMRVKKKRTKKQLRASANESYGKSGSKARKKGKINK